MKITFKLALALLPGALVVVAAAAFLELGRDRAEFEADQRSDDRTMAGAFADTMGRIWENVGENPVRTAMDRLGGSNTRYRVRWIDLRGGDTTLPTAEQNALRRGEAVIWQDSHGVSSGWLHAVSPVHAHGAVVGAVDVSEPPPDLRAHVRRTILATVVTTLALAATMMLLTLLVGAWVVGGPISALIEQARRVAAGDLHARSLPRHRDELGALSGELNRMLDRLETSAAELRESMRERFAALEQLRHAERLTTVGRLASSVAHEMGTPLNVVTGRARLILDDDHDRQVHAGIIIDQADRMAKIIRQLLDYARRRPPQKEAQDLVRLTADLLPLLATLASKNRIELRLTSEVDAAPVTADRTQVQQALTNLIVNAIQASAGGAAVDVTLQATRARRPGEGEGEGDDDVAVFALTVRDHGPGMSSDVLARVFEPFFTTKPVGESTGLGLSVAKDIVDEHGGWLDAESQPGHGSRFTMYIPGRTA